MLDRTGQRIVGVLLEKELAVPDSYPMTVSALLAGCNQKSNRDPEMSLEEFEVSGALMALRLDGWVVKLEGGRADRFRHDVDRRLGLDAKQRAVLAELLLRGPQAPGALKTRVARMGFVGPVEDVEAVLESLRDRPGQPLVERLPRAPRERDARWAHCLGERGAAGAAAEPAAAEDAAHPAGEEPHSVRQVAPAAAQVAPAAARGAGLEALEARVARLEAQVAELTADLARLRQQRESGLVD
jgi:uncharacterized protein YceH (UPF0502 family)